MNIMRSLFRLLIPFCLFLGVLSTISPRSAHAVLITWNYSHTYVAGTTATGSFDFDNVSNTFSNISITTTGETTFSGFTFTQQLPGPHPPFLFLVDPSTGPDFTGAPFLRFNTLSGFGTLTTTSTGSNFSTCSNSDCTTSGGIDFEENDVTLLSPITGTVSTVPEPATFFLLGSGLLGLAGYRWHQRRREGTQVG